MGYTASKLQAIDKTRYEDSFDSQGATSVIKRMKVTPNRERKPKNPTRVLSVRYTAPEDIPKGTVIAVPTPSNLYDCTTWDDYYRADDVEYDYMGYFASKSAPETETKVFLTQSGSGTATQNFAFEGMEDLDMDYVDEGGGA